MIAAQLRADVAAIALPEGRMVGSRGHARARAYLERRLAEVGLVPYRGEGFPLDGRGFHAAIVMDLIGHDFALAQPELANLLVATGVESSGALPALETRADLASLAIGLQMLGV